MGERSRFIREKETNEFYRNAAAAAPFSEKAIAARPLESTSETTFPSMRKHLERKMSNENYIETGEIEKFIGKIKKISFWNRFLMIMANYV